MRATRHLALLAGVLALVPLTGCRTTQDKAAEARAQGEAALAAQVPLAIPKPNEDLQVGDVTLLDDENGTAVVVEVGNPSKDTLVGVPILIDVRDAKGKTIFKNDTFGSEYALNHVPLIEAGGTAFWVNDQILANGAPKTVKVTLGQPDGKNPGALPEIAVSPPRVGEDSSGTVAEGTVTNKSKIDQAKLVLFAVARGGGRVVAAGRGGFKNLKVGARPGTYNIFFIGDPRGAEVEVTAPPSVLK